MSPLRDRQELLERRSITGADFEAWWRRAVHDGVVAGHGAARQELPRCRARHLGDAPAPKKLGGTLEVIFRPDPTIYDGRFANNGWLQELPKPITKLTWDNAAILSPATAHRLAAWQTGDMVELTYQGRSLHAPVWVQPGHADGAVTLHLGYGRTHAGRAGTGMGFNPYGLRTADGAVAGRRPGRQEDRRQLRLRHHAERSRSWRSDAATSSTAATWRSIRKNPEVRARRRRGSAAGTDALSRLEVRRLRLGHGHRSERLHGCSACMVACQAENNIAVVGKDQVRRGRAMHWIRVDSYYQRRRRTIRRSTTSRCRACSARTRRANWSARCRPPCTAPKA